MSPVGGVVTDRRVAQSSQPSYHSLFASSVRSSNPSPGQQTSNIINENEFPSLGRNTPSGGGFSPLASTSGALPTAQSPQPYKDANHRANYATLMRSNDGALTNPEFTIQSEDFPALSGTGNQAGGAQTPIPSASGISSNPQGQLPVNLASQAAAALMTAASETLAAVSDASSRPVDPPKGIITRPDGEVSNIPPSMLCDQFGMAGLLTYLRSVDNPPIVSLALGYDLTTLGLNLNLSERHLYTTFGGPWADSPIRPHELDVKVPEEYLTNTHIRDKLPPVKLNKLSEDVLFYLFYNCPGEVYQLAAACELFQRDWRYHKSEGVWLTRSQYGSLKEQTGSYEKGAYNVFDQMQWRKIPKELKLEYKELEERPKLPQTFSHMGSGGGAGAGPAGGPSAAGGGLGPSAS